MSASAHLLLRRAWLQRRLLWLVGLLAAAGIAVGVDRAFFSGQAKLSWPPKPCVLKGVSARCGSFVVPENRAKPDGRRIALHVVVVPAHVETNPGVAVAFLAGGPGSAASEQAIEENWQSTALNEVRDLLLVDQRGTGGSKPPHDADVSQYGTGMAMDDLNSVRAALGYRKLDLFGGSYGATAAQVYLKLHPSSVRTVIINSATALEIPFFGRFAVNAQRALDQLAQLCASQPACRKAFPGWERQFSALVRALDAHPVHGISGVEFASVVHTMLLNVDNAVSIPLVVSQAAKGNYGPFKHAGPGDLGVHLTTMGKSIWCNEPWGGLDATGPWGTAFDSYTTALIANFRKECHAVPRRAEPRSLWRLPISSRIPVLAWVGGADPQDPPPNLPDLKQHFPESRTVVLPHLGHQNNYSSCLNDLLRDFIARGTTKGLGTTNCADEVVLPPFSMTE